MAASPGRANNMLDGVRRAARELELADDRVGDQVAAVRRGRRGDHQQQRDERRERLGRQCRGAVDALQAEERADAPAGKARLPPPERTQVGCQRPLLLSHHRGRRAAARRPRPRRRPCTTVRPALRPVPSSFSVVVLRLRDVACVEHRPRLGDLLGRGGPSGRLPDVLVLLPFRRLGARGAPLGHPLPRVIR